MNQVNRFKFVPYHSNPFLLSSLHSDPCKLDLLYQIPSPSLLKGKGQYQIVHTDVSCVCPEIVKRYQSHVLALCLHFAYLFRKLSAETVSEAKVHSPADGKMAFSWENKPGISKGSMEKVQDLVPELPLPPSTAEGTRNSVHNLQIPLPPCAFQPPYYRSTSSKKGLLWMQEDDPFLAAYKECTKGSNDIDKNRKLSKTGIESSLKKSLLFFSCKRSCSVRDNNFVRVSQLPHNVEKD